MRHFLLISILLIPIFSTIPFPINDSVDIRRTIIIKPIVYSCNGKPYIIKVRSVATIFDVQGTTINDVWTDPNIPEYDDHVVVYAKVSGADEVYLNYTYGGEYFFVKMSRQEGTNTYYYILPPNRYGTSVTFRIQAYNYTSGEAAYSDWYSFTYDDYTPPEINNVFIPNDSMAKSTLTFALNTTEPENASGINGAWLFLQYSPDNKSWGDYEVYALSLNHTTGLWEIKLTFIYHGYYRYYLRVNDNAGNMACEPEGRYYHLRIYPRYADIICDDVVIRYGDTQTITIRLMDLNSSTPLPQEYIDVYLNTTSDMLYLTTVQTNTTGYARFMLTADRSVGEYQLIFVFQDPSYRTATKKARFTIIPELVSFYVDYDSNTYDVELIINIADDEGDPVDYGYLSLSSGSAILYDNHITTHTVTLTISIWDAVNRIENDAWWLYFNVSFYGNENYENTTQSFRIPIYATRIDVSYNATVVQGQVLALNICIYDPNGILNYTILVDEWMRNETVIQKKADIFLEHPISIGARPGNHTILILVTDVELDSVCRTFSFIVKENRILLDADKKTGEGSIEVWGTARYEVPYDPHNITVIVVVKTSDVKIYDVTCEIVGKTLHWRVSISFSGRGVVEIIASDPWGHSTSLSFTINVPAKQQLYPIMIIPVIAMLGGVLAYVIRKRRK